MADTLQTLAQMHAYYAARAPYYDAVYLKPERQEDIAFLSTHLPDRFRGSEVLELACGTGYWTQHLARTVSRLVATDGTAEPLDFARLRPGAENVIFRHADAYALPSDLGTFDGAFGGLWFSHVPVEARVAFLQGLHALLRPGARVVFIDNNEVQLRDYPIVETDRQGNTFQARPLADGSVHRVLKNFPTEAELKAVLSDFCDCMEYTELANFWMVEYTV
jgi:demethylmenaquinone methyltransferase/2-methoxy-6-polyprenyl-1,4-benzoquinol methylase